MKPTDNPCYKCVPPKRKVECHGTCKEHKEYLKKYREEKAALRKKQKLDRDFRVYEIHKTSRLKNWNHEQEG